MNAAIGGINNNRDPRRGDLTLCGNCMLAMVFTDEAGSIREAVEADLEGLDAETLIALALVKSMHQEAERRKRAVERHERN
jgi:hypothetical protein